jgi:excisionase family DNA binding protein
MNKEEAARRLDVSVRTLQRMVQRGEIAVAYVHSKQGKEADFEQAEVERVRELLQSKTYVTRPAGEEKPAAALAVTRRATGGMSPLVAALKEALGERLQVAPGPSITDLAHKLTLSLLEAAQLSGLSRGHLRQAIEEKRLKARIIGRGFRVKRSDLDAYVRKL